MSSTNYISYDTIRDLRHSMDQQDSLFPQVDLLWQAMTDWVTAVDNCAVFLTILHEEVGEMLTKEHLKKHRDGFRGSYGIPGIAWKGETMADLELLFDYYPELSTLDELFPVLNEDIRRRIGDLPEALDRVV